ncbi:MAG: tannase/feruloyl esterase family alpha/beta hydrolase, partial [Christensenellales bacterium]
LVGLKIPVEAFKETTKGGEVISAEITTSETDAEVQYVNVFGYIYPVDESAPNIEWRMLLPMKWNGRSVQLGGGANNGSIPKLTGTGSVGGEIAIDKGYVVYGDDSGHQAESSMDASFASNDEALSNYTRLHLIKAYDAMCYVTNAFYGQSSQFKPLRVRPAAARRWNARRPTQILRRHFLLRTGFQLRASFAHVGRDSFAGGL